VGYPSPEEEVEILKRRIANRSDEYRVERVTTAREVLEIQSAVEDVYVDDSVLEYIVAVVRATREHLRVEVGASPRASVMLMKASRALALLRGRDYVTPDDVKELAPDVLAHRIVLKTELWVKGVDPRSVVRDALSRVPVPREF